MGRIIWAGSHIEIRDCCFPWKSIWKQKILYWVAFFVWIVALVKCLMIDNLQKRKVWILNWCYMCKCNGENWLTNCQVAIDLWYMVLGLIRVSWVMPKLVVGLLACWQSWFGYHRNGHIWIIVPHCLMWCFWRERNNRCFEDCERSIPDRKLFFFRTLLDWLFALRNWSSSSICDFLDSCNFCIWPLYTPYVLGCPFFISINLITFIYIYIYKEDF